MADSNSHHANLATVNIRKFYFAAVNRNLQTIRESVISDGVDVNHIFDEPYIPSYHIGGAAIHILAEKGNQEVLHGFIKLGANVCLQNKSGDTAIHIACKHGNHQAVQCFLESDDRCKNIQNKQGITPLMRAIYRYETAFRSRYLSIIKALISYNCDVNLSPCYSKMSPLHMAAGKWDATISRLLIDAGAKVNARDSTGSTPLFTALSCMKISEKVVKNLVSSGANVSEVNRNGKSPLHIAVSKSDDLSVQHLLQGGANPNIIDNTGLTPLIIAVKENNIRIVPHLLAAKADVNYLYIEDSGPLAGHPISILGLAALNENVKICKLLIYKQSGILNQSLRGTNVLKIAVMLENMELVKLLLSVNYPAENVTEMFPQTVINVNAAIIFRFLLQQCIRPSLADYNKIVAKMNMTDIEMLSIKMETDKIFYNVFSLKAICKTVIRNFLGFEVGVKVKTLVQQGHIGQTHADDITLLSDDSQFGTEG